MPGAIDRHPLAKGPSHALALGPPTTRGCLSLTHDPCRAAEPTKGGRFAKLACCGFVFAVLAVVSWVSVSVLLHQGLAARFIVTSTDNPNFASWATANTDKTEQYTSYHMWDLTNAADVQNNGAK